MARIINGIYFDEVSGTVDEQLTTYLNFDNIDLTIKSTSSSIDLIIKYRGRGGYFSERGTHVSARLDYAWFVSLLGSKSLFEDKTSEYTNVSVSIKKTIFNHREIVIQFDNKKRKSIVLYGDKVFLRKLITQDAILSDLHHDKEVVETVNNCVAFPKRTNQLFNKMHKLFFLVPELLLVLLFSYIAHRFLHNNMTSFETLWVYGLIGLLVYIYGFLEKIEHIFVFLLAVAMFVVLPYRGFALAMVFIYLLFLRKNELIDKGKTNIFIGSKAKERLLKHLQKIGQIKP